MKLLMTGIVIWLACAPAAFAQSSTAVDTAWVTNGPVRALASSGNQIFVGGEFTQMGPSTGGAVPVSLSGAGSPTLGWARVLGSVNAIAADGSGGFYLGGSFTHVDGVARQNLAHILASGELDLTWAPSTNGQVRSFVLQDSKLHVGGTFGTVNGQTRLGVAQLDATGALTAWNARIANGWVNALLMANGALHVGGNFTAVDTNGGPINRYYLAAFDTATGAPTSWVPSANQEVSALAVSGTTVIVGGRFSEINTIPRLHLAAIDANSQTTAWNPYVHDDVTSLAISGSTLYAGGVFTVIGPPGSQVIRNRLAAWTVGTNAPTAWDPNINDPVNKIAVHNGVVYIGGSFTNVGGFSGATRRYAAGIDASTGAATAWNPEPGAPVWSLLPDGDRMIVGGDFTLMGGVRRSNLAALDATTGIPTSWSPNPFGVVNVLRLDGPTLYVGGDFGNLAGQTRQRIAAFDVTTGTLTPWAPSFSGPVEAIAVGGGRVFVGGTFANAGGQARGNLAAIDAGTGAVVGGNPVSSGPVYTLEHHDATVYAGGAFINIGGQSRNRLAGLDENVASATAFNPNGASGFVFASLLRGAVLHVGGTVPTWGGVGRQGLASFDLASSGALTPWTAVALRVEELDLDGEIVYVAGRYPTLGNVARDSLGAVDAVSGTVQDFAPTTNSVYSDDFVNAVSVGDDVLAAGGNFTGIGGVAQSNLALFGFPAPGATTGDASAVSSSSATVAGSVNPQARATGIRFAYGTTTDYGSTTPATDVGAGTSAVAATADLTGLAPSTTYHYRAEAVRGGVVKAAGADRTFTTGPAPAGPDPTPTPTPAGGGTPGATATPAPTATPVATVTATLGGVPAALALTNAGTGTLVLTVGRAVTGSYTVTAKVPRKPKSRRTKTETLTKGTFAADATGKTKVAVKLSAKIRRRACALKSLKAKLTITVGKTVLTRTFTLRLKKRC